MLHTYQGGLKVLECRDFPLTNPACLAYYFKCRVIRFCSKLTLFTVKKPVFQIDFYLKDQTQILSTYHISDSARG